MGRGRVFALFGCVCNFFTLSGHTTQNRKGDEPMTLIPCTDPCIYQQEGQCTLARAASPGEQSEGGCLHFLPRISDQHRQRLPDIANRNEL